MSNCIGMPESPVGIDDTVQQDEGILPADSVATNAALENANLVESVKAEVEAMPDFAPARLLYAPPGTGKTHAIIRTLAEDGTRAIYAAPTHDLCIEVAKRMRKAGIPVHYWREGPDEADACPHEDLVAFYRAFGYRIRRGPCRHCFRKSSCAYRKVFSGRENRKDQVLVMTSWHLRRPDFWTLKATENRDLLVIDEDVAQALAAPSEIRFDALSRFVASLQAIRDRCGSPFDSEDRSDMAAWLIRRLRKPESGDEALLALTDILRRACLHLMELCARHGQGQWLAGPGFDKWLTEYDRQLLDRDDLFERLLAIAYGAVSGRVEIPNLFARLRELLVDPKPVHASHGAVRWASVARIPPKRRIVLLDATAEPSVAEGVVGRPLEVLSIPPVGQKAAIVQVMDRLLTRSGTRRDIRADDGFIRTFLREAAARHRDDKLLVVTFLEHEDALRAFLQPLHPRATVVHYGALRGLDAFGDYGAGIVIGRPMPNETRLSLLAVSAFGMDALSENLSPPDLEWTLAQYPLGDHLWQVRCQRYGDPRWEAVWRHVVAGELLQAVGRLRPLTNPASIYVLTSEPVPSMFDMQGAYAGELFPSMLLKNRRSDFRERVRAYADAHAAIAAEVGKPTNKAVCERMGISRQNGLRYKELALECMNDENQLSEIRN